MTRKRDCILCQARAPLCSYYPSRGLALRRKRVAFGLAGETAGFRTPHIRFRTAPTKCVDTSLREGRGTFVSAQLQRSASTLHFVKVALSFFSEHYPALVAASFGSKNPYTAKKETSQCLSLSAV